MVINHGMIKSIYGGGINLYFQQNVIMFDFRIVVFFKKIGCSL
jgi:hypothetical protein